MTALPRGICEKSNGPGSGGGRLTYYRASIGTNPRLTKCFPLTPEGLRDAIAWRDAVLAGQTPEAEKPKVRVLDYAPHRDDFSDPGPKPSTVGRVVPRRVRGEHNRLHGLLSAQGLLQPGDEIKTSRDSRRDVLGAAAHMHLTSQREGTPVGRIFLPIVVSDVLKDYIAETFGIDVQYIEAGDLVRAA